MLELKKKVKKTTDYFTMVKSWVKFEVIAVTKVCPAFFFFLYYYYFFEFLLLNFKLILSELYLCPMLCWLCDGLELMQILIILHCEFSLYLKFSVLVLELNSLLMMVWIGFLSKWLVHPGNISTCAKRK